MKTIKAKELFKVGKNGIGWVDSSFTIEFGGDKVEKGKVLTFQKLSRGMKDSEIISELKVQECKLGDVFETLKNATEEMRDGYANLFYIKDHPSRVVDVGWFDGGWRVFDCYRDDYAWGAGPRVFSPATSGAQTPSSLSSEALTLETAIKMVKKEGYKILRKYEKSNKN